MGQGAYSGPLSIIRPTATLALSSSVGFDWSGDRNRIWHIHVNEYGTILLQHLKRIPKRIPKLQFTSWASGSFKPFE